MLISTETAAAGLRRSADAICASIWAADGYSSPSPAAAFWEEFHLSARKYLEMWQMSRSDQAPPEPPVEGSQRARCEQETDRLIQSLESSAKRCPETQAARATWKQCLVERLRPFAGNILGYSEPCVELLFSGPYRRSTADFVRQARAFNPDLASEDLFQALRNVWIANSLQLLLERPLTLTPPIFAYSMLYPYTDNALDDPAAGPKTKRAMGEWLTRRLQGSRVPPRSARERDVARLLELIEEAYPDAEFPRVRWSLQAIHAAQMASLRQQSPAHPLPGLELLRLSVEKGGASVLADGCLVGGQLDPAEADFVFGYGVVLQLLDDLQDVRPDLDAGHETIFTRAAARGALDEPADRLRDFMRRFFASSAVWTRQGTAALRELIASSCGFLIRNAVALNPSFFTPEYSARIERGSRFSFAFVRERRTRLLGACGKLRHSFERRQGLDGLLELLG